MGQNTSEPIARPITGDDLLAMGDIGRTELIDGRIVYMTPTGGEHAALEIRLGAALDAWVRPRGLGWVLVGEVGIYTRRNPDRVRGADVAFISKARRPGGPGKAFLDTAPELVVEIMSPDDRWQDVRQKIEEYFAIGVDHVWVVEPDNRVVLVYESPTEARRLGDHDTLTGEGALAGFALPIAAIFAA